MKIAIGDPVSSAARLAQEAKRRGFEVVEVRTFSEYAEYYSRNYNSKLFDRLVEYRGDDAQALAELQDVDAVLVGADSCVAAIERINLFRGQAANAPDKILARCDKVEQAKAFAAAGIPVVPQRYFRANETESALRYANMRGYPQVLKPRASGGTNSVYLANDDAEFRAFFEAVSQAKSLYDRPNGGALVMNYVDPNTAREIVVDAVSCDGRHVITDVWAYEKTRMNGTPAMYRAMRTVPFEDAGAEIAFALRMLNAAGYRQGASHTELWHTAEGQLLPVEVGFRLPGLITQVSADVTGRDQVALTLDSYVDPSAFHKKSDTFAAVDARRCAGAVVFLTADRATQVQSDAPMDRLRALPSYHSSSLKAEKAGDQVAKTVDVASIVGWVALAHASVGQIEHDIAVIRELERQWLAAPGQEAG
jgi:biotin carboxylase